MPGQDNTVSDGLTSEEKLMAAIGDAEYVPAGDVFDPLSDPLKVGKIKSWEKNLNATELAVIKKQLDAGIGVRHDKGKPRYATLIPILWIRRLTEVLEYGANKYTDQNWKGLDAENCLNSGMRHLLDVVEAMQTGGDILCRDKESGLLHIYQAAWNLLAAGYIEESSIDTK